MYYGQWRGLPPSSPDRGTPDFDGYSTASEMVGHRHRHRGCRGCRGSRKRKWLAPARLDMPIFKLTNLGAEVMYTLWCFDVDAFLEQYDEASMHPNIFASLREYLGKWAYTLDEGKDLSVQDLLMHMESSHNETMLHCLLKLADPHLVWNHPKCWHIS